VRAVLLLMAAHEVAGWPCKLDPSLPANLTAHASSQPLCEGFLNVSGAPYGAKGDGTTDDTEVIQAALDDAYEHRMAVLLPAGRTFLISRQLRAVEYGMPIAHREYVFLPPRIANCMHALQVSGLASMIPIHAPTLREHLRTYVIILVPAGTACMHCK
jgi:hypothetical protein